MSHILRNRVYDATVRHVDIKALNAVEKRRKLWHLVKKFKTQRFHFFVNARAEGSQAKTALGRPHFDEDITVARGAYTVQQSRQQGVSVGGHVRSHLAVHVFHLELLRIVFVANNGKNLFSKFQIKKNKIYCGDCLRRPKASECIWSTIEGLARLCMTR